MQSIYLQEYVFQHKFKDGVCVVIRLTIFGIFSKCAISISSGSLFQCEFNHDVYFGIRLTIVGNLFVLYVYIYMCYTPFLSTNGAIIVSMSSRDYLFTIFDMIIITVTAQFTLKNNV